MALEGAAAIFYGGIAVAFLIRNRDKLFFGIFLVAGGLMVSLLQAFKHADYLRGLIIF